MFLSYYLVKPLRNSQFLKEFTAYELPAIYLVVSFFSVAVTRLFQWCAHRTSRKTVVAGTFLWATACKLFFFAELPLGGPQMTFLFYLWASVYFLLLVSTLWGCLNERFRSDQSERCFPFIVIGSTVGNVLGSLLSDWTAGQGYWTLIWSALALLIALVLLWGELGYPVLMAPPRQTRAPSVGTLWWLKDRYLRAIASMVLALAVSSTCMDLIVNRRIDQRVGLQLYQHHLAGLLPEGFEQVSALRTLDSRQRQQKLAELAGQNGLEVESLRAAYASFSDQKEQQIRRVFSQTYSCQGIAGIVILSLLCRPFLSRFGLGVALIVLPTVALLILPTLLMPLDVLWIQLIMVASGSLNYSFNNATKEILYTATDRRAIIDAKPFIEGPLMRLGDVLTALLSLGATWLVVRLGWPRAREELLMVIPCSLVVMVWWVLVRQAGRAYDALRASGADDAHEADPQHLGDGGEFPESPQRKT